MLPFIARGVYFLSEVHECCTGGTFEVGVYRKTQESWPVLIKVSEQNHQVTL